MRNLELAFERIRRGSNREYKQYYRHLFPSYVLGLPEILRGISTELKNGTYQPSPPTIIHQPKKSGILRPITLIPLRDQIVYQALVNRVADKVHMRQKKLAFKRRFGALYAGPTSQFFFRSWKAAYASYTAALTGAYRNGKDWVADFDLVSCYELIDHNLLRACLLRHVSDAATMDVLCTCLATWTTNTSGSHLRHGLPQGPEASAFLAECVLFKFDDIKLKDVTYLRYIDDIKLLTRDESSLRRAVVRLDLISKDLGLVPQAQKLEIRRCTSLAEITKTIPSSLVAMPDVLNTPKANQILTLWRKSLKKTKGRWDIDNQTHFRYSMHRLGPRRDVLRRAAQLLTTRPDNALTLALFFRKFPSDKEAAGFLLDALRRDPTYDASAAAYIEAMDICEPTRQHTQHRRAIQTATKRSVEQSIVLRSSAIRFRTRRASLIKAMQLILKEPSPHVAGLCVAHICAEAGGSPFSADALSPLLERYSTEQDADLARYSAALLLQSSAHLGKPWKVPSKVNNAVRELLVAVGLRSRGPTRTTALEIFFSKNGVVTSFKWKKALGNQLADLERRTLRLRHLRVAEPTAFTLMLDTFNEALVQRFSVVHPSLKGPYLLAAGNNANPDYGAWIWQPNMAAVLPVATSWFRDVHKCRLEADLAHAKHKKGPKKGKPTKVITYADVDKIMKGSSPAWRELVTTWRPLV